MKLREPGAHGIGIKVEEGDRIVIPEGWLNISANPLKGTGHLTRSGLQWFADHVFANDAIKRRGDFSAAMEEMNEAYGEALEKSPLPSSIWMTQNNRTQRSRS
jgi:hypothetical protein